MLEYSNEKTEMIIRKITKECVDFVKKDIEILRHKQKELARIERVKRMREKYKLFDL
jgi:hypothetical protein